MSTSPIHVVQPFLPPLEEYFELLKKSWDSGILTHNGPHVQRFEHELCDKLGTSGIVATSNGTIAIQMAIKALGLRGEIITTPFTWVATISAIKWEGCTPVFCDVDPETFNINPDEIEEYITDRTVAILPVHVFGNPCEIDRIQEIADRHGLKVIYDAAHAVGSCYDGKSVFEYGDISATSFHATKLINTGEGGACVSHDPALVEKLQRIRFFGHDNDKNIVDDGFNGKMSEINAALGIASLKYLRELMDDRKKKYMTYREGLEGVSGISFQTIDDESCNFSYFPVLMESESDLIDMLAKLNGHNIWPRRYFYPALNTLDKIVKSGPMPVTEDIARRIACLPLYKDLGIEQVEMITSLIRGH